MELSPRLQAVAGWVPAGAVLADVGTDHGLLPVCLMERGHLRGAIASDLRPGPLEAARRTAARAGLEGAISFRLCDGLTGLAPHEADTVVIAGMGGETIAGILAAAPWTAEGVTLLLQPQSTFCELRAFLSGSGYAILRENLVRDGGRLYVVLEARGGQMEPLSPGELWAGKNTRHPLRGEYLDWLSRVLSRALAGRERAVRPSPGAGELSALRAALDELGEMKKEWTTWQLP